MLDQLRTQRLVIFVRGSHCCWCPKRRWSPRLGASETLKINENRLEMRKLRGPKVRGAIFPEKSKPHSLFMNPSKNPKMLLFCHYNIRGFLKLRMSIPYQLKSFNLNKK